MDKVYLLLRKNLQTGPYTYEELLQQQLLPTDLIWVEGKSTVWHSPSELTDFMSQTTSAKQSSPEATNNPERKRVIPGTPEEIPWYQNRKSPEVELEERALALRQRAESAATEHTTYRSTTPVYAEHHRKRTIYQESTIYQEESPVLLEVHTINKKSVSLPQLFAAGIITALIATGWYNREVLKIVRPQQNTITQAAAPAVFQVSLPTPPKTAPIAVVDTVPVQAPDTVSATLAAMPVSSPRNKKDKPNVKEAISIANTDVAVVTTPPVTKEEKEERTIDTINATEKPEKKEKTETTVAQAASDTEVDQPTTHKKKGLGQAIKNIFKKKKKDDDKSAEENSDTN